MHDFTAYAMTSDQAANTSQDAGITVYAMRDGEQYDDTAYETVTDGSLDATASWTSNTVLNESAADTLLESMGFTRVGQWRESGDQWAAVVEAVALMTEFTAVLVPTPAVTADPKLADVPGQVLGICEIHSATDGLVDVAELIGSGPYSTIYNVADWHVLPALGWRPAREVAPGVDRMGTAGEWWERTSGVLRCPVVRTADTVLRPFTPDAIGVYADADLAAALDALDAMGKDVYALVDEWDGTTRLGPAVQVDDGAGRRIVQLVDLPEFDYLDRDDDRLYPDLPPGEGRLWALTSGLTEDDEGHLQAVPQGIFRRLDAGLASIKNRGTSVGDWSHHGARWHSPGGAWSNRQWIVYMTGSEDRCIVAVEVQSSTDPRVWTRFRASNRSYRSSILSELLADRMGAVMAGYGAEHMAALGVTLPGWTVVPPRDADNQNGWSDTHGRVAALWDTPEGAVILETDGGYGRRWVTGPDAQMFDLEALGWRLVERRP